MRQICKLLILHLIFSTITTTPVDPCSNGESMPVAVDVVGCETQPCTFVHNTNVELYLNFTAPENLYAIEARVVATLVIEIPFRLDDPDACPALTNTHCPLEINEPAQYKLVMPISTDYPPVPSIRLAFGLLGNGQSEQFTCFSILARLVQA